VALILLNWKVRESIQSRALVEGVKMSKGIYTAVSGAIAQSAKMDTIANNLANVNTPGFKRDSQIFKEYLSAYEKEPTTITVPRVPASIESFYDMQGGDKSYVDLAGTATDFTQGGLKQTGNSLDLALEGDGFFEVLTPEGVRFTRAGSFTVDNQGRVTTKQGFPVLKEGVPGTDPTSRFIQTTGGQVSVGDDGQLFENGTQVGKLSIVNVSNKEALQKIGSSFYGLRTNIPAETTNGNAKVIQGFVESSNVNIVSEMSDMISATRTFESTQKAIQAYDEMQKKLVNEVPKT
jgi:flagellar basal-body rod protein FlgF